MEPKHQNFGQEMTAQERWIDDLLARALEVTPPAGLSQRVTHASFTSIVGAHDQNLEPQLDIAFAASPSQGFATRVFKASVASLSVSLPKEPPMVIARFDSTVLWRQTALAACLAFTALIALYFVGTQQLKDSPVGIAVNDPDDVLSPEEEGLLLEDLNLSAYAYLADTRELAFADIAASLNSLRDDIELWQFGLLTE